MKVSAADAVAATGARALHADALPDAFEIATDTRSDLTGRAFLALRGERFDGHDHVAEAYAAGAVAVIVSRADVVPAGRTAFIVDDTLPAYLALAAAARNRVRGPVVAISGSTGKTTTKTFAHDLLVAAGRPAVATPENENNEIGVAKFLLGLDDGDERVAIVEMGARKFRDLDVLVEAARPEFAILTNVGEAHLEVMGSRERLAETKWGLFRRGAHAILSLNDAVSLGRAGTLSQPAMWAGLDNERPPDDGRAVVLRGAEAVALDGTAVESMPARLNVPGEYNRRNAASAFALGVALGVPLRRLGAVADALRLPHGRYEALAVPGGVRLIYDAYNASMSGTLATLAAFAAERGRRIAVIGGMAELGADSAAMHERVGSAAAAAASIVLAGGAYARDTARGARANGATDVIEYDGNATAAAWLRANVRAGDVVLLKGSRAYRMEQIRDALAAEEIRS